MTLSSIVPALFPAPLLPARLPLARLPQALRRLPWCVALLAAAVPAQEVLRQPSGSAGSGFGQVAAAGDVDGDGLDDLIVGAPDDGAAGTLAGSASVLSGADGSLIFHLTGGGADARFGTSCAAAGDVDGDGLGDLIVGAPGAGKAFVHSGADGSLLLVLQGAAAGTRFGHSVAGVGDMDGDGLDDVAVGAPDADVGGTDTGSVTVYSGATGAMIASASGATSGDEFGVSLGGSPADTLKGDNEGDVIIGATAAGGNGNGYLQARSLQDFSLRWQLGGAGGERLGVAVAVLGDVDGDGWLDVAAGTDPRDSAGLPAGPGAARLLSGFDGSLVREHTDGLTGSGYGTALTAIGDVTGDGVPDLGVGAPRADNNGVDSGSVHLYSGVDGAVWYTIHGSGAGARFGAALAYADDVDGSGIADIAVGAPGEGQGSGRVYVLSVSRWDDTGGGLPGIAGVPRLTGEGGLIANTQASLTLTGARASTTTSLVLGYSLVIDAASGMLVPAADVVTEGMLTSSDGSLVFSFEWPTGMASGTTVYHQFLINDPDAPGGLSRSNAVAATVP